MKLLATSATRKEDIGLLEARITLRQFGSEEFVTHLEVQNEDGTWNQNHGNYYDNPWSAFDSFRERTLTLLYLGKVKDRRRA